MMRALRRTLRTQAFVLLAILLLAAAVLLAQGARRAEEETQRLAALNDAAEAFAAQPLPQVLPPPPFPAADFHSLGQALSASGARIEDMAELSPLPAGEGEILRLRAAGTGTFLQVLSLFDIIHMKPYWVRADLTRLSRRGPLLSFEVELGAYRSRGTYEEEKHRTDGSDGNGEEPGSENPR